MLSKLLMIGNCYVEVSTFYVVNITQAPINIYAFFYYLFRSTLRELFLLFDLILQDILADGTTLRLLDLPAVFSFFFMSDLNIFELSFSTLQIAVAKSW